MFYSEIKPSEKLAKYIKCYWVLAQTDAAFPSESELILPDGCPEIIFNHADSFRRHYPNQTEIQPLSIFVGQMRQSVLIEPTAAVKLFGIRFYPEGAYPLLKESLVGLTDKIEELDTVLGALGKSLEDEILSATSIAKKIGVFEKAVSKMFDHEQEGALVKNASGLIRKGKGLVRVEELANQFEVSIKTLERHFNREIGVSPKFFSRIMRLQEVLKLLNDGEEPIWTDIAYSFGYVDQAHFIKDFKDFAGVTPKIYHQQHNTINDSFIG